MNLQSFTVALCVLAALVYLLRAALRRWRAGRLAAAPADRSGAGAPACGGCRGCSRSGDCH